MEKVPETIEDIIGLLPPARQQTVRRQLAKIAEENQQEYLLFELSLVKLADMQRNSANNAAKPVEVVRTVESSATNTTIEALKKDVIGEVSSLRKGLSPLAKIEEDTKHIRARTDSTESKLDSVRPYRVKVALIVLSLMILIGACAGWYGHSEYARYQREQYRRSR